MSVQVLLDNLEYLKFQHLSGLLGTRLEGLMYLAAKSSTLMFDIMTVCYYFILLTLVRIWHHQLLQLEKHVTSAGSCHLRLSAG
jgi:hypothetical protein